MTKAQIISFKRNLQKLMKPPALRTEPEDDKYTPEEDKPENKFLKDMREIDQSHEDYMQSLRDFRFD